MAKKRMSLKICGAILLVLSIAISGILLIKQDDVLAEPITNGFKASHEIKWADGNAGFGKSPASYVEGDATYYRDGSIIEVSTILPAGHNSAALIDEIEFDSSKVEMLSTSTDIASTIGKNYLEKQWSIVSRAFPASDARNAYVRILADSSTITPDTDGGTIFKVYFQVKQGVENATGEEILFRFPAFEASGADFTYLTEGFDPDNVKGTYSCECPPVSIYAKTPNTASENEKPTIDLSDDALTIYEGDVFNPIDLIGSVTDSKGNPIDADNVTITGSNGENGAHQPNAGDHTFTYTITDEHGKTETIVVPVSVVGRTYEITSVSASTKSITLAAGTAETKLQALLEGINKETFKVKVTCNDGTTFDVDAISVGGSSGEYKVNKNGNLVADQKFDVTYDLVLPIITYDKNGVQTITTYNGSDLDLWHTQNISGEVHKFTVNVTILKDGETPNDSNNNGTNGGTKPSTDPSGNGSSTSSGSGSSNGVDTGDTTNTNIWMMMALVSFGYIVIKMKKENKNAKKSLIDFGNYV